ncbi:MAG: signal recognition particle-docking protein FtsY [Brachybacterium alimentarium]
MDPNDILALIAGGGGSILVIGAGAWAFVRSRGKRKDSGDTTGRRGESTSSTSASTGSTAQSTTAVKERPAAPSWADTLSAPTAKPERSEQAPTTEPERSEQAPTTEPEQGAEDAAETTVADETATEPGTADPVGPAAPADDAGTAQPAAPAPSDDSTASADAAATVEPAVPAEAEESVDVTDEATLAGAPVLDTPEAPADRMVRLRDRLARSGAIGRGILGLLTRGSVDEDTWDEIEETLLLADLGPDATDELLDSLRRRIQVLGTDDPAAVREVLREELIALIDPELDRRLAASRRDAADGTELPSVLLMVGVNGTGKTTTVGKLARVLVAAERSVVLGAADTFRAAAADQLETWGSRVGVETVRADRDGADPAAVAFDAVKEGIAQGSDVVIIDTAGRLQNKKGLMDELGKVRRVAEKGLHGDTVAEVLLVIDATTGQNGLQQARVFSEAVQITGIVLTKLDGTAKGGIVVKVQRELGVPVKMVGLGEGMDDLTPFDPHGFVDALLGD